MLSKKAMEETYIMLQIPSTDRESLIFLIKYVKKYQDLNIKIENGGLSHCQKQTNKAQLNCE